MNGSNVNFSLVLNNDKGSLEKIVLEPWAEEIILKAGDQALIQARGPVEQPVIELEYREKVLIVYGWTGSKLEISINGERYKTASGTIGAL